MRPVSLICIPCALSDKGPANFHEQGSGISCVLVNKVAKHVADIIGRLWLVGPRRAHSYEFVLHRYLGN